MPCLIFLIAILLSFPSPGAGESRSGRYLYLSTPDGAQKEGRSSPGILIFDIDHGHKFVRRIDIPIFEEGLRGMTGNLKTHSVYYSTTNRRLGAFDLETEKVVWEKTYLACCDRSSITPDGRKSWDLKPLETGSPAAARPSESVAGDVGTDLPIDVSLASLRIEEGTLIYRDMRSGLIERVDKLNAEIAADSLQGPFRIKSAAIARGLPLTLEASTGRITDDRPLQLRLKLDLAGNKAVVNFNGALSRLAPDGSIEGVTLKIDDAKT